MTMAGVRRHCAECSFGRPALGKLHYWPSHAVWKPERGNSERTLYSPFHTQDMQRFVRPLLADDRPDAVEIPTDTR